MRARSVIAFQIVLALLVSPAVAAQPPPGADAAQQPSDVQNTVDITDVIRHLLHKDDANPAPTSGEEQKRMRAIAPVIGAKPSSGVIAGVAGNVAFFRGDPATTSISSTIVSATVTSKKQAGISAHTTMFGADDRWRFEGDYRFQWTSLETFALGTNTQSPPGDLVRFDRYRLHQVLHDRLREDLFVGGGILFDRHTDIRPDDEAQASWMQSSYYEYTSAHNLPLDAQTSAGVSAEVIWDSRDSFINPDRGWFGRASYRALFDGFLGGASTWDKLTLEGRTYAPLSADRRHKLAFWTYADLVLSGVAPYFDLPSTGSDSYGRSGRGYAEGHFRGEKLAFVEVEYRAPLTRNGLLGMVSFVNTTTIANHQSGERLFDHFASGAGAGLRLLLNKRSKTNLAFDVGFGEKGNRGIYLTVQEAF